MNPLSWLGYWVRNKYWDIEQYFRMDRCELTRFLRKAFPNMTQRDGRAVWWLLENRELIVNGKDITGSFRYNASAISLVAGYRMNYMNYYCGAPQEEIGNPEVRHFHEKAGSAFSIQYALYSVLPKINKAGGLIKTPRGEVSLDKYLKKYPLAGWAI